MPTAAQRTGIANLPLHYGKVPPWLFGRMSQLAREIVIVTVDEFGAEEKPVNIVTQLKKLKTLNLSRQGRGNLARNDKRRAQSEKQVA